MYPDFHRQLDVGEHYRRYLRFLRWFIPSFFVAALVLFTIFHDQLEGSFVIGFLISGAVVFGLIWMVISKLSRTAGSQSWTVANDRASYESPSRLLGASFDVPLSEVTRIRIVDECNGARCDLADGTCVAFSADNRESYEFYQYLERCIDTREADRCAAQRPAGGGSSESVVA